MFYFDTRQLVADVGGPTKVAALIGKGRTAIYGWYRRQNMPACDLATIKGHFPNLDLNRYVRKRE